MFTFLEDKLYRKKFFSYTFLTVALSVLAIALIFSVMLYTGSSELQDETAKLYYSIEKRVDLGIDEIERYMVQLYNDEAVIQDMMSFIGNDTEEYMTLRLENSRQLTHAASFVDSLLQFTTSDSAMAFSQVSVHDNRFGNVFFFGSSHVKMQTLLRNSDDIFRTDISSGVQYERQLAVPNTIAENAGSIKFVIDSDYVFEEAKNSNLPNLAAVDESGNCYLIKDRDGYSGQSFVDISELDSIQSSYYHGINKLNYYTINSGKYGFKLVLAYGNDYIAEKRLPIIIALVAIILVVDAAVIVFIARSMGKEWAFLGSIIRTIELAKVGKFKPIKKEKYKNEEYNLIAEQLNDMCGKLQHLIETEYLLKLKQQKTEMVALQHQIEPHFLYNTLEIIRACAVINDDNEVADALTSLGKMYRGITKSDTVITMEEEIGLLESYLALMSFKYKDSFSYRIQVEPDLRQMKTLKFWMQPIAENYFKHGYNDDSEFNLLAVTGYDDGDSWIFEFINNGEQIEESKLTEVNASFNLKEETDMEKIGLANVYQRLRYFYGKSFSMEIKNNTDSGIAVIICIGKDVDADV